MKLVEVTQPVYVYHGTSEKAWAKIQAVGHLGPQKEPHSFFRGNMSTLAGITELQIYLTGMHRKAEYYASEQAEHAKSKPIVLKISLDAIDINKCFPDDDDLIVSIANAHKIDEKEAIKLLSNPTPELKDEVKTIIERWRASKAKFREHFAYQGKISIKDIAPA